MSYSPGNDHVTIQDELLRTIRVLLPETMRGLQRLKILRSIGLHFFASVHATWEANTRALDELLNIENILQSPGSKHFPLDS